MCQQARNFCSALETSIKEKIQKGLVNVFQIINSFISTNCSSFSILILKNLLLKEMGIIVTLEISEN